MNLSTSVKYKLIQAGSLFLSVCAVVFIFLLQAVCISSKKTENKIVKIWSAPKKENIVQQKNRNEIKQSVSKFDSSSIVRNLPVNVPKISSSNFYLPEVSIKSENQSNADFSLAVFSRGSEHNFSTEIFELDMLDKIPRRLDKTIVDYPKQMLKRGIEGYVKLLVIIDTTGVLSIEKVIDATNSHFAKNALAAVDKFLYEVPKKNGKSVKARFELEIPFKIIK
ncbi:MAG: TonB family protein [Opitutales bacterium]|nr:TonB family protein [Opitutales bacterium]